MKTKYLAFAGLVGLSVALYFLKRKTRANSVKQPAHENNTVLGERHIRGIMKKSKLTV